MATRTLCVAAAALALVGCVNAEPYGSGPSEVNVYTPGPSAPVAEESLASLMDAIAGANGQIGRQLAKHNWRDVADAADRVAQGADRARRLKDETADPTAFAKHCDDLIRAAADIHRAAAVPNTDGVKYNLEQTTRIIGMMQGLVTAQP